MKYTIEQIIEKQEKKERLKFLLFWGHRPSKDGSITTSCLSQWWHSSFESEGKVYKTAEHWMMAKKAELFDDSMCEKILEAPSPGAAKALGRKVKDFSQEIWNDRKYDIVKQGSWLKFSQNEELGTFLLGTKDRILVEASPVDRVWGIGLSKNHQNAEKPKLWRGKNLLGFALMETRDKLLNI